MILEIISSVIATILIASFLYYRKWKIKHIISLIMGLAFTLFFSVYGATIITPIWKGANASDLWIIMFALIYIGGSIFAVIPFYLHEPTKKHRTKLMHLIKIFLIAGLTYTIIDNALYGPFAVGPSSPYIGKDLCHLPPTYVAEDVFFGCQVQRIGIDPYSDLAANLVYFWITILIGLLVLRWVGSKKLEKLIYDFPQ